MHSITCRCLFWGGIYRCGNRGGLRRGGRCGRFFRNFHAFDSLQKFVYCFGEVCTVAVRLLAVLNLNKFFFNKICTAQHMVGQRFVIEVLRAFFA
jgi:hypothetical protein